MSIPRIFPVRAAATGPYADPVPRGLTLCWGLLYFNGMAWIDLPPVPVPLPMRVGQAIAYGSLGISLLLALRLNPRLLVRANAILGLYSAVWVLGLLSSMRLESGFGALIRCGRLAGFLAIAWLLTPFWGQPKMPLLRAHLRVLWLVVGSIVLGLLLFPTRALAGYGAGDFRLIGTIWPIAPTQVGLHAAMLVGFSTALWLSGVLSRWWMFTAVGIGVPAIFLSGTRTALAALLVGCGCSALSVFVGRLQVRRLLARVLLASPLILAAFAVIVPLWGTRGQDAQQITQLTGRTKVWARLLNQERDALTQWIGVGLTDKGYEGLSIDNLWLSVFQDIGYLGVGLIAAIMIVLAGSVIIRGPSPGRAVGAFIVPYLMIASITEVGLGDASVYVLHALVTASVLQSPLGRYGQRLQGGEDELAMLQWPAPTGARVLAPQPGGAAGPATGPAT